MSEIKDTENVTSEVVQEVASEVTAENSPGDHEAQQANILDFDDLHTMYDNRSAKELIDEAKKETAGEENQSQAKAQGENEAGKTFKEEAEKAPEEIKKLFGKLGEEEIEIASNTKFKHIVDGIEGEATLQELINNYSGKVNWDKKYQEMTEYRNEYNEAVRNHKQEVEKLNNYVGTFKKHLEEGDALGALEYFASFAGMKPYEFRQELIQTMAPEIERYSNMTNDQYRAERASAEVEYMKKQQESEQIKLKEEQANQELLNSINEIRETHSISEEEFRQGYLDLAEDSDFSEELSPDMVGQYVLECRAFSKSDELLGKVSSELSNNEEILESVQKMVMENPDFADEDYLEIIQEAYNETLKTASTSVSKKVEKTPEKQEQEERRIENYLSFEDLI